MATRARHVIAASGATDHVSAARTLPSALSSDMLCELLVLPSSSLCRPPGLVSLTLRFPLRLLPRLLVSNLPCNPLILLPLPSCHCFLASLTRMRLLSAPIAHVLFANPTVELLRVSISREHELASLNWAPLDRRIPLHLTQQCKLVILLHVLLRDHAFDLDCLRRHLTVRLRALDRELTVINRVLAVLSHAADMHLVRTIVHQEKHVIFELLLVSLLIQKGFEPSPHPLDASLLSHLLLCDV